MLVITNQVSHNVKCKIVKLRVFPSCVKVKSEDNCNCSI
jgi:hypothetical protein